VVIEGFHGFPFGFASLVNERCELDGVLSVGDLHTVVLGCDNHQVTVVG
jgi:hypothetical protein